MGLGKQHPNSMFSRPILTCSYELQRVRPMRILPTHCPTPAYTSPHSQGHRLVSVHSAPSVPRQPGAASQVWSIKRHLCGQRGGQLPAPCTEMLYPARWTPHQTTSTHPQGVGLLRKV